MRKKLLIGASALLLLAGGAFFALGGAAWLDARGLRGQERAVTSRMRGYWEARLNQDTEAMTHYVHPTWGRVTPPGLLQTRAYEIQEIKMFGEDRAAAKVAVTSVVKHPLVADYEMNSTIVDRWMLFEGQWYREPGPRTLSEKIHAAQGTFRAPWKQEVATQDEAEAVTQ
jgi:hypothetical protein